MDIGRYAVHTEQSNSAYTSWKIISADTEDSTGSLGASQCTLESTARKPDGVTIKANYRAETIKFELPLLSGLADLVENVTMRLYMLKDGDFTIKVPDVHGNWVLISRDEDLQTCMASSRSVGQTTIRMLIEPMLIELKEDIKQQLPPLFMESEEKVSKPIADLLNGKNLVLNKLTGKICYILKARALTIAWIDDPRYWKWSPMPESKKWSPIPESRFSEVAELLSVCWLDIRGKMDTRMLSPKTTYAAYLVFRRLPSSSGLDAPVKTLVRFVQEKEDDGAAGTETINAYLKLPLGSRKWWYEPRQESDRLPQRRRDGWSEIELGEFFNDQGDDGEVEMILKEIEHLNWKRGLIIKGMELRPKEKA